VALITCASTGHDLLMIGGGVLISALVAFVLFSIATWKL
jgi:hypothetical protein